jgi:hypothetical protein
MQLKEQLFFTSPPTVRKAMLFLVAGWISLLSFIYHINIAFPGTVHSNNAIRVAIVGLGIGFFVFRIRPWARTLCIIINIGAIGINVLFLAIRLTALGLTSPALTLHALLTVLLFGACTYFLLVPPTAAFFRAQLPANKDKQGSDSQESSNR